MTTERAMRLAAKWAAGHVCTLREGEAQEYHELCLEALKQTQWISVKERLPEVGKCVLIYSNAGRVAEGQYTVTQNWVQFRWSAAKVNVTHWMPLPKPPEEVKEVTEDECEWCYHFKCDPQYLIGEGNGIYRELIFKYCPMCGRELGG